MINKLRIWLILKLIGDTAFAVNFKLEEGLKISKKHKAPILGVINVQLDNYGDDDE